MRLTAAVLVSALTASTACGGLTHNHKVGLAAVGGLGAISGSFVVISGMGCDDPGGAGAHCSRDDGKLISGGVTAIAGAALFTWAMWMLHREPPGTAEAAPAATPSPSATSTSTKTAAAHAH